MPTLVKIDFFWLIASYLCVDMSDMCRHKKKSIYTEERMWGWVVLHHVLSEHEKMLCFLALRAILTGAIPKQRVDSSKFWCLVFVCLCFILCEFVSGLIGLNFENLWFDDLCAE